MTEVEQKVEVKVKEKEKVKVPFCPLINSFCIVYFDRECAFYDIQNGSCAILTIAQNLRNLEKDLDLIESVLEVKR